MNLDMANDAPRRLPLPPIPKGTPFIPDHRWRFTETEAKAFAVLVRNPVATPEMIAPLLPGPAAFIEGIARKAGPYGVDILSCAGGWELLHRLHYWHYFLPADVGREGGSW